MTRRSSARRAAAPSNLAAVRGPRSATVLLATGLGLILVPAARVQAAESGSTTVRWRGPDGAVRGTVPVKAKVSSDVAADGWLLRLLGPDGQAAAEALCSEDFHRPSRSFMVQCKWDTVHAADGQPAANQRYLLRLMVRTEGGLAPVGEDLATATVNPAAAPGQVELKSAADGRMVLSWAANSEPDLLHYDVEERSGTGSWTRIGEPTATTFEAGAGQGRTFRVAAERRGPDGETIAPTEWTTIDAAGGGSPSGSSAQPSTESPADETSARPEPSSEGGDQPSPASGEGASGRSRRRGRSGTGAGSDTRARSGSRSRRKAAPSPESGGPSDERDNRANGSEAVAEPAGPPSGPEGSTRPDDSEPASTGTSDTPPADRARLGFSESSATAFHTLAAAPPGSANRPVTAKGAPTVKRPPAAAAHVPEPDPGFGQALPYAPPAAEQDPVAEEQAALFAPAAAPAPAPEPLPQHRSNGRQRAEGLALAVTGFALLGLLARPGRRSRRRPGPQSSLPEVGPTLSDLAARLASIEARLGDAEDGTR